ncbi:MAG: DUF1949 domain-containing protein [Acholeplasmatales bacterium]|nr:DUF1949 domain-containing protein [Acholeplasmatales bacterium]
MPSAVGYQPTLATEMGKLQERITSTKDVVILDTSYQQDITLKLAAPGDMIDSLIQSINNITKGNALIEDSGLYETFVPID